MGDFSITINRGRRECIFWKQIKKGTEYSKTWGTEVRKKNLSQLAQHALYFFFLQSKKITNIFYLHFFLRSKSSNNYFLLSSCSQLFFFWMTNNLFFWDHYFEIWLVERLCSVDTLLSQSILSDFHLFFFSIRFSFLPTFFPGRSLPIFTSRIYIYNIYHCQD